jgi:MYXO-CTERM domain-containing protein
VIGIESLIRRKHHFFFFFFFREPRMNIARVAFATTVASLMACGSRDYAAVDADEPVATQSERLFVMSADGLWPNPSNIPVCWETSGVAAEKALVVEALRGSWETAAPRIHFTGFGACTTNSRGIRIFVSSGGDGPHVEAFGRAIDGIRNGLQLQFEFSGQGELLAACAKSQAMRLQCIKAIAIHEFGHALGFFHEQDRSDTPQACLRELGGGGGPDRPGRRKLGAWDLMSIMNYCYPNRRNVHPAVLSPGDVAGVRQMYPGGAPTRENDAGAPVDAGVRMDASTRIDSGKPIEVHDDKDAGVGSGSGADVDGNSGANTGSGGGTETGNSGNTNNSDNTNDTSSTGSNASDEPANLSNEPVEAPTRVTSAVPTNTGCSVTRGETSPLLSLAWLGIGLALLRRRRSVD